MNPQPKPTKEGKKRHKVTIACDITPKVKKAVWERDKGRCIIPTCRSTNAMPNAHFIPRSQLGLGIEQNIVTLCQKCHNAFDNGKKREEYGQIIEEYLKSKYPDWDKARLIYDKNIDPRWLFDYRFTT